MTARTSIASLVAAHNVLAAMITPPVKPLREKTSLNRATIQARIDDMQAQVDASTELVTLVSLCNAHNVNAKSIRARFRALYARTDNALPEPVGNTWAYRPSDVAAILPHITR